MIKKNLIYVKGFSSWGDLWLIFYFLIFDFKIQCDLFVIKSEQLLYAMQTWNIYLCHQHKCLIL